MIQVARRLQARHASPCISSATPPPATTSTPGHPRPIVPRIRRTLPLTRFVPYRPVFQTSPATLTQHTHCHHHWCNQLGPDSPQSWFGKKARLASRSDVQSHYSWFGKKHIAYHSRAQPLAWQKHGVWLLPTVFCVLSDCIWCVSHVVSHPPGKCRAV